MLVYHAGFASEQKIRYRDLARRQNTRVTILPIHTKAERALFKMFIAKTQGLFAGRKEPNWIEFAKLWSDHADGINVFYKV